MHYHQVFGCPMGLPVSAVVANLVMDNIVERALSTSPTAPRWWQRYVDNCKVGLKRTDADLFYQHLNSINSNIQFTIECACQNDKVKSISFLDSRLTVLGDCSVEVDAYRKATHTNKYLDFASHNPGQHREAVVKTLLNRANFLPLCPEIRMNDWECVLSASTANGYPGSLLRKCLCNKTRPRQSQERPLGFAVLPYVKGAFDCMGRVLWKFRIWTAFRPVRTLAQIFKKPKDQPAIERVQGIVYNVSCHDCAFTYVGESKRLWSSRRAENDPGHVSNRESAIKQHTESTDHNIHPQNAQILERGVNNYHNWLFLESWYSALDSNAINKRKLLPRAYLLLI